MKYSIQELESMRKYIKDINMYCVGNIGATYIRYVPLSDETTENMLRTYVLNGTTVEELRNYAIELREKRNI